MALTKWGFVYTLGGDGKARRRDEIGSDECRLIALGVPDVSHAADAAVELTREGCEMIEYCGAFGARAMADVLDAVSEHDVPVGAVTYGGDATAGLHRVFEQ